MLSMGYFLKMEMIKKPLDYFVHIKKLQIRTL